MAQYGKIIDMDYIPERDNIYQMFIDYFNNPVMTKIKNENDFSMYMTKAYCLTALTCRYIIVFVNIDSEQIGVEKNLEYLRWISFQTRTLDNKINIVSHGYTKELKGPLLSKIKRINITPEASTYVCDELSLIVTLLHTKQKTQDAYQDNGNIILALESWETIITFTE